MPEPKLVIIGENMNGKEFPLNEGENRIGRVVENEIVLKDRSISRRHAVVRNENGACVIEDIGSHNGIEINGTKVQSCELSHGLEFRLGDFLMLYTDEAPGSQALINQPQVPAQWQELFDGSKPSEQPEKTEGEQIAEENVEAVEDIDLFAEDEVPDTATAEGRPARSSAGLILYIAALLFIVLAGLLLLHKQSTTKPWEETRDHIMKKGEKRVFLTDDEYRDAWTDDETVASVAEYKFLRKDEKELRVFILVEAVGPGTARIRFRPSIKAIRIIVQDKADETTYLNSNRKLTIEQRLQMGRLLLRSGQIHFKKKELAKALKEFRRAEEMLRPAKSEDPLYAETRGQMRKCERMVEKRVEELKNQYYTSKGADADAANTALERILVLVPDQSDPLRQITRLILGIRLRNRN